MKKKLSLVLAIMLTLVLALPTVALSAEPRVDESEVDQARRAGQVFVNRLAGIDPNFLEWKGAHLVAPQLCYNLEGQVNAYMFAIEKDNRIVGRIVVGSSSYGYTVFEAGEATPFPFPTADKVKSSLGKYLGIKVDEESIGEPRHLVYLGFGEFYAIYEIKRQMIGVNLVSGRAVPASELKSYIGSPQEFKAAKKQFRESKPEPLGSSGYKILEEMHVWRDIESGKTYCGPCTGVSIGDYYRDRTQFQPNYPNLYGDNECMYDRLYDLMECDLFGGAALPVFWEEGIMKMTQECGYNNFGYVNDDDVTPNDFWVAVSDINMGWPLGWLMPSQLHWRGIKGYWYDTDDHRICCTDSKTGEDNAWYYWPSNIGAYTACIKD